MTSQKSDSTSAPETKSSEYSSILVSEEGRVGIITLNRPQALNALNQTIMYEVVDAAQQFDVRDDIGAIIITGSSKAFAAGADIKEMSTETFPHIRDMRMFYPWTEINRVRTPIITAVSGFALGGGCELAMMGDILLASDTAKFGQPEITLGVIPGMGGTQRLIKAVGKAKAMDMVLTGRLIDAEEAERSGLVARVIPAADFEDEVKKTAHIVAGMSKPAATMVTELIDSALETTLEQGLQLEREMFWSLFATEDQKEGMSAFMEKRKPVWKNK